MTHEVPSTTHDQHDDGGPRVEGDGAGAGPARSDAELRAALDALLAAREGFDGTGLELLVTDGVVVMLGVVPDYQIKRALEQEIAKILGVREIHDQLQVSSGGSTGGLTGLRG